MERGALFTSMSLSSVLALPITTQLRVTEFILSLPAKTTSQLSPSKLMKQKTSRLSVQVWLLSNLQEKSLIMLRPQKKRSAQSLEVRNCSASSILRLDRLLKRNSKSLMFKSIIRLNTMRKLRKRRDSILYQNALDKSTTLTSQLRASQALKQRMDKSSLTITSKSQAQILRETAKPNQSRATSLLLAIAAAQVLMRLRIYQACVSSVPLSMPMLSVSSRKKSPKSLFQQKPLYLQV